MTFASGSNSNSTSAMPQRPTQSTLPEQPVRSIQATHSIQLAHSTQSTKAVEPRQSNRILTGKIQANFSVKDGKTILTERVHHAPLKIAKTFHLEESGGVSVYMMDASPGIMDGDRYEINMTLDDHCEVFLTNQSYTKIHPTPNRMANMTQTFQIGKNALLEYFPEPTIPYANSRFQSNTVFQLDEEATLIFSEITLPGRLHRGELFQFEWFSSKLEVYRENQLVAWDHMHLEPKTQQLQKLGYLEHYTHIANLWIFSTKTRKHLPDLLSLIQNQLANFSTILGGVSLTCDQDICVRMLGTSTNILQQAQTVIWALARKILFNKPAYILRK